jgi:hypothetical protein
MLARVVTPIRHLFRWDLDKTYLKTEFDTVRDLVRMARLTAEERENIPGSAALLRAIKAATPEPDAHGVYFISGSPNLIRAVIEKKFNLDGFQPDGFTLKPTLSDVIRGRFRAVRGQVAYKLAHLLHGRAEAPVGTPETLFGDDAENDAFIYTLYADAVAGRVPERTVLDVVEAAGAYPDQVDSIREALASIVHEPAIRRIIIHLDQQRSPEEFEPFLPEVVPIANHLQTAIILVLDGTLPIEVVRVVAQELLDRYQFGPERLERLASDFLASRRRFAHVIDLPAFARSLRAVDPARPPPGDPDEDEVRVGSVEATARLLARMADVAEEVAPAPSEVEAAAPAGRDYIALWAAEVARAEEMRRQRKEAAAGKGTRPDGVREALEDEAQHDYARAVSDAGSGELHRDPRA